MIGLFGAECISIVLEIESRTILQFGLEGEFLHRLGMVGYLQHLCLEFRKYVL
ncbi:hypothetical protein SDC9_102073 [bioreactor metagenome]|uniref:Uncharacterized protein n=1 Tax=bioreactor metagenome TaxID=1076179 RepID=A0A645AQB3_9ZZZZ